VGVLVVAPQIAQGGTALNDGVGLALMIAAAALALSPAGSRVRAVGALAAGLAVGTKLNLLVPVAGLAIAAIISAGEGRRRAATATWIVGLLAGGGFWFARDLAHTGSPLPLLNLGPLPHVRLLAGEGTNLVQALRAGTLSTHQITSSLSAGLGRAWPVLVGGAVAGLLLGIWRGSAAQRAYGWVGFAALTSYAFTPLTGSQFLWTVRYAAPALALGLVLLAVIPATARPSFGERWAPVGLLALLAATLHPPAGSHRSAVALGVAGSVLALLAMRAVPVPRVPASAALRALAASAALAAALIAGYPVAHAYVRDRFTVAPGSDPSASALVELARFAGSVQHARIAIAGMELQYQFGGPGLSNYVQYIGHPEPGGNWAEISTCAQWRRTLDAGHYNYVVTAPTFWPTLASSIPDSAPVPAASWTGSDPAAREILHPYPTVSVFELRGSFHDPGCERIATRRRYHRA
jgi:hypothetical protein